MVTDPVDTVGNEALPPFCVSVQICDAGALAGNVTVIVGLAPNPLYPAVIVNCSN